MPLYTYECSGPGCPTGGRFTARQMMREDPLSRCPECGGAVERIITPTGLSAPLGDAKYKDMGFTKLVRRDQGVYENVTATGGESRFFEAGRPETMPHFDQKITD